VFHALVAGGRDAGEVVRPRDVDDQGVEGGPGLDFENAGDGARVERVRAQPIDGFGREGDEAARPEDPRGLRDRPGLVGVPGPAAQEAAGEAMASPPRARAASIPQAASMSGPPE
jgi:hypothetical protein